MLLKLGNVDVLWSYIKAYFLKRKKIIYYCISTTETKKAETLLKGTQEWKYFCSYFECWTFSGLVCLNIKILVYLQGFLIPGRTTPAGASTGRRESTMRWTIFPISASKGNRREYWACRLCTFYAISLTALYCIVYCTLDELALLVQIYNYQCWGSVTFSVRIRIRIPVSVPLTNGSGSNSGSDSFLHWL